MDEHDLLSITLYYGRAKLFSLMQKTALEGLGKYPDYAPFRLLNGIALVLGNRMQEAIRELSALKNQKDVAMSTCLGLIYAHKRCNIIDKEAIIKLDVQLKEERKKLTADGAYYAAIFLFLTGKIEKGREYAEKSIRLDNEMSNAYILKGWTDLYLNANPSKTVLDIFENQVKNRKNIDAWLGAARYFQINNDFENAITVLNRLSVRYPEINIFLVEKMETQLASWNWDHAYESALRILNLEPTNISALRIKAITLICRDGNFQLGIEVLQHLFAAIEKHEPTNWKLVSNTVHIFSRICDKNEHVLALTFSKLEKIVQCPGAIGNPEFLIEQGYHSILIRNFKEATKYFRSATKLDDSSIHALCGLTLCQLAENGPTIQARQQIEFLKEIQGNEKNALLSFMSAKIHVNETDKALSFLVESCEAHFGNLKTLYFGHEYLLRYDPDFLLDVAEEFLMHSPIQFSLKPRIYFSRDALHLSLKHCINVLESVVKTCPGMCRALQLLAKVQFLCGENTTGINTLQNILSNINPKSTDAQILMSQIVIQQGEFEKAQQCLETCLAEDFDVKANPMYHLLCGIVLKNQLKFEEAQKNFVNAMSMMRNMSQAKSKLSLSLADKVTLCLELVDTLSKLGQVAESEKSMQDAVAEFRNTSEEARVTIANADLMLSHGNANAAVDLLNLVERGQFYVEAKTKLAEIYLLHKKDRVSFAQQFQELVSYYPEPESYLRLGDAYMFIQEPDLAIEAYKEALKKSPHDPILASKLGRSYVKTHQYKKAIAFYSEAILNPQYVSLKMDLSELYLKLKQYSNAEQILLDLERIKVDENDLFTLKTRTKRLLLLARVREKSGNLDRSLMTLKDARDNQLRIQKRLSVGNSVELYEQNKVLSKICVLMAEAYEAIRNNEEAILRYKEALKFLPQDLSILKSLARLYVQGNQVEQCKEVCRLILNLDPINETASVVMADLSFRKMDFEEAGYHFSQLLTSKPTYWTALARLIEIKRRTGNLHEVPDFIRRAEEVCLDIPSTSCAGLFYCKGIYEWFFGNPNSALRFFNNIRSDAEWGQQSIFKMIEICLNPDGDFPTEITSHDSQENSDYGNTRATALKTAERLIKELRPRAGGMDKETINYRLLQNFLKLASRDKNNVQMALNDFSSLVSQDEFKELTGPVLGSASGYVMLKQTQRARNLLKRVAKNTWNFEDAEYLERCWLFLADLYIQNSKYDMARELLQRVLQYNKSSAKAYELIAIICEKQQNHSSAVTNYEFAWRLCGKSRPYIGYKLAFNYMKVERYADGMEVCEHVLNAHPDYPSIREDILEKCLKNIAKMIRFG